MQRPRCVAGLLGLTVALASQAVPDAAWAAPSINGSIGVTPIELTPLTLTLISALFLGIGAILIRAAVGDPPHRD